MRITKSMGNQFSCRSGQTPNLAQIINNNINCTCLTALLIAVVIRWCFLQAEECLLSLLKAVSLKPNNGMIVMEAPQPHLSSLSAFGMQEKHNFCIQHSKDFSNC